MKRSSSAPVKKAKSPETLLIEASKKILKTKLKQEKESKKLFESMANKLLSGAKNDIHREMESMCRELVSRSMSEMRHDLFTMESAMSSRLVNIESKLSQLNSKIDDVQNETNKRIAALQDEVSTVGKEVKASMETERTKRLTGLKKLNDKNEQELVTVSNALNTARHDHVSAINAMNDDLRVQAKEIATVKERIDEILIKQYGYLPTGKTGNRYASHGFEANSVLENIATRLQKLEVGTGPDDNDFNTSFNYDGNTRASSPMRGSTMGNKNTMGRIRKLEEHMLDMQTQIKENETDVQHLKNQIIHKHRNGNMSPSRGEREREREREGEEDYRFSDMRDMEKKFKKLVDNTSKACKSLSNGLSDVQQATLNLYSWTDQAHDAFETVSKKLDLPANLCPRAKIASKKTKKFEL